MEAKTLRFQGPWEKLSTLLKRNEVLHYDFMFVRKSEDPSLPQYILVIKDDLSYYVELCPADTADHFAVADCLLEWSNRLDAAKIHVSDRGKHFNNSVLAELNRGKF